MIRMVAVDIDAKMAVNSAFDHLVEVFVIIWSGRGCGDRGCAYRRDGGYRRDCRVAWSDRGRSDERRRGRGERRRSGSLTERGAGQGNRAEAEDECVFHICRLQ